MIVPVKLDGVRDYPVYIDESTGFEEKLVELTPASAYVVITNDTIAELYRDRLDQWKNSLPGYLEVVVPDGEKYKDMETVMKMLSAMLEKKLDRKAVVIAFGGGVIGDMVGLAASLFLRGVRFVQVPTTLLSMVDSSVGGKTAVNHAMGKNLIGAFYQPKFVWIETAFLDTLPQREYIAGCGEVMKYGFIGGAEAFAFVQNEFPAVCKREESALRKAIALSVEIKASVVAEDETEQGKRALLNFGHTFGHALEHDLGYGNILHGEGIFWGIRCAIELGLKIGTVAPAHKDAYETAKKAILYPEINGQLSVESLYEAMFSDKKVSSGTIRFVVPTEPGTSIISSEADRETVLAVMNEVFASVLS